MSKRSFRSVRSLLRPGIHLLAPLVLFACDTASNDSNRDRGEGGDRAVGASGGAVGSSGGGHENHGGHGHSHDGGTSSASGGEHSHGAGGSLGGSDEAGGGESTGGGDSAGGTGGANTGGGVGTGGGSGGAIEQPVHGCIDYVDRSAPGAERSLLWNFDLATDPERCLAIRVGQSVTWTGNFGFHPLGGYGGDTPNPIGFPSGGDTWEVTFPNAGTFGFICDVHAEMQGAIRVQP